MRKLVVQMQMSADGYVSAADPGLGWQVWNWGDDWTWDDPLKAEFNRIFESIDCILLSRKMAEEGYLTHWGKAAQKFPANPHFAFAKKIVDTNKVVLTNKLRASKWERTRIANGELAAEVNAMKNEPGRDIIVFGGVTFASALVRASLVDEFQFFVNPTAVGRGRSIFPSKRHEESLKLRDARPYACGIVIQRYEPVSSA